MREIPGETGDSFIYPEGLFSEFDAEAIDGPAITSEYDEDPTITQPWGDIDDIQEVRSDDHALTSPWISVEASEDPRLIEIDEYITEHGDGLDTEARRVLSEMVGIGMLGALEKYNIPGSQVKYIAPMQTAIFVHKGNHVRLSCLGGGALDVKAWDSKYLPETRDKIWDDYTRLTERAVGQNDPEHQNRERGFAIRYGFRDFQIRAPGLRLAVPLALHILEQPHDKAYDMVGKYSDTSSLITIAKPGVFSGTKDANVEWVLAADGSIVRR